MNLTEGVSEWMRVLQMEQEALQHCYQRFSKDSSLQHLEKILECFQNSLDQGGKIIVTGLGKSGKVGQKIVATLCSTGSLAVFLHPTEGLHGDLGIVQKQDIVLALSYTGNTEELLQIMIAFKKRQIPVVGLGGNPFSQLAAQCHFWIDAQVDREACPHNLAPTSSTTLALALGDALALSLMKIRGVPIEAFAENHPGGSIGKKIRLKVCDLMHSATETPVIGPQALLLDVITSLTQKPLGAVLVVKDRQLLGLITDGDIRRSLQKYQQHFFEMTAEQVMTQAPLTVQEDVLAHQALRLMEDRSSQIGVLPVVNSFGEWQGLLRLHDLVGVF